MGGLLVRLFSFVAGVFCVLYYYTDGDFSSLLNQGTPLSVVVRDDSKFMGEEDQRKLQAYHMSFLEAFDLDYRVELVAGAVDVDAAVERAMRARSVGGRSTKGAGVLLFVAPDSNRVRFRATSVEGQVFSESFISYMQNRQMSRSLRKREVTTAVLEASALIYQRLLDASEGKKFDARRQELLAKGIDPDSLEQRRSHEKIITVHGAPIEVFQAYIHAMRTRNADPNLPIYSRETQDLLLGQPYSPEAMASVVKTARNCPPPQVHIISEGRRAVLRYPVYERQCAPWFMVVEDGAWRLDLTTVRQILRTDSLGEWHFILGIAHPYESGFSDWLFNGDGYPEEH